MGEAIPGGVRTVKDVVALSAAFLEAKGWLDGDREFLRHRFDARCADGGAVHRRLLDPLFFGTLNAPVARRAPASRVTMPPAARWTSS